MALIGTDTFTGTNGTNLTAHSPDTGGGTWVLAPSTPGTVAKLNGTGGVYGDYTFLYNNQVIGSADYSVTMKSRIAPGGDTDGSPGPVIRHSSSAATGYTVIWSLEVDGTGWHMYKRVTNTLTVIGAYLGDSPAVSERTVIFKAIGTTLTFTVDGVDRITVTDASIAAGGFAGIWVIDGSGGEGNPLAYSDSWSVSTIDAAAVKSTEHKLGILGPGLRI